MANSRNIYDYETLFDKVLAPIDPPSGATADWNYGTRMTLSTNIESNTSGYIHGIRFWKPTNGPNGDHIPELWINSTKQSIDVSTFDPETPGPSWQYAWFTTPFAISGHVNFAVAYNGPAGHNEVVWLDTRPHSSEHLTFWDGGDGAHGAYYVGNEGLYPSSTQGFHFGADVIFSLNEVVPGTDTGFVSNFRPWMGRF